MQSLVWWIVAAVVVLGGGWFVMTQLAPANAPEGEGTVMEGEMEDFTGSVTALLKLGRDVMCTFERTDEGMTMNGTVYVAGSKMRGEFNMTQGDMQMTMSTIRDGTYGYSWGTTPFGTVATKVKLDAEGKPTKEPKEGGPDLDDVGTYRCAPWSVDQSKFTLPAITFTDISAQVEAIDKAMAPLKNAQCGACDQIPDADGKAQCKAALGC